MADRVVGIGSTVLVNVPPAVQQTTGLKAVAPGIVSEVISEMIAVTVLGATVGSPTVLLRNIVAGAEGGNAGTWFWPAA